jgi:hypothetical protein
LAAAARIGLHNKDMEARAKIWVPQEIYGWLSQDKLTKQRYGCHSKDMAVTAKISLPQQEHGCPSKDMAAPTGYEYSYRILSRLRLLNHGDTVRTAWFFYCVSLWFLKYDYSKYKGNTICGFQ